MIRARVIGAGACLPSNIVTNGGRVLGVTALGADLAKAQARAYEALSQIHFDGMHFRRDIGSKALAARD